MVDSKDGGNMMILGGNVNMIMMDDVGVMITEQNEMLTGGKKKGKAAEET